MAYCSYCGNMISEQAVACPQCGHPVEGAVVARPATTAYASFGRRFGALLIDGVILGVVGMLLPADEYRKGDPVAPYLLKSTFYAAGTLMTFVYRWLMIAFVNGQTVGKMALGIRIARPDGSVVGLGPAAVRAAMAIVSAAAFGLGYLWAAWDPERRTWHDMVAGTRAYRVGG